MKTALAGNNETARTVACPGRVSLTWRKRLLLLRRCGSGGVAAAGGAGAAAGLTMSSSSTSNTSVDFGGMLGG